MNLSSLDTIVTGNTVQQNGKTPDPRTHGLRRPRLPGRSDQRQLLHQQQPQDGGLPVRAAALLLSEAGGAPSGAASPEGPEGPPRGGPRVRLDISKYLAILVSSKKKGDVMSTEDNIPQQDPAQEHAGDHRQGPGAPRRTVRALPPALPRDGRALGLPGRQRGPARSRGRRSPGTRRTHSVTRHGHCDHRHDETETAEPAA